MSNLQKNIQQAVRQFWTAQSLQKGRQGSKTGQKDYGRRSAVTGGKQMDGFVELLKKLLIESGVPAEFIFDQRRSLHLPGYFRPTKQWDVVIVYKDLLVAAVELKSHVGSFGNNANNRAEEAIGSGTDYRVAVREGAFGRAARAWLGYFMLLEEAPEVHRPTASREPHFAVFPEFKGASYAKRYEILCEKLIRENIYNSACLLTSPANAAKSGEYQEPNEALRFEFFVNSLIAHVLSVRPLIR